MLKLNIQVPNINKRDRVPMAAIQAVVEHLVRISNPEKIILFGLYVYGQPKAKAYLHHLSIDFPRTHNLPQLLSLCEEQDEAFSTIRLEMQALNGYSIEARYPGYFTSIEEGQGAVRAVEAVRGFIRLRLNI